MVINTIGALDSGIALLLVVLCLVILSVSMLRRSEQRRATTRDLTREQLARVRDQKDVRRSMDDLLVQLEEASRRVNAQVDTRFAKLEAVIRDADDRIARLKQLAPGKRPPPTAGGDGAPGSGLRRASSQGNTHAQPSEPPPAPQAQPQDQRRQRIYELADTGTSAITIADTLQVPVGEVELILRLRKFK